MQTLQTDLNVAFHPYVNSTRICTCHITPGDLAPSSHWMKMLRRGKILLEKISFQLRKRDFQGSHAKSAGAMAWSQELDVILTLFCGNYILTHGPWLSKFRAPYIKLYHFSVSKSNLATMEMEWRKQQFSNFIFHLEDDKTIIVEALWLRQSEVWL